MTRTITYTVLTEIPEADPDSSFDQSEEARVRDRADEVADHIRSLPGIMSVSHSES